MAVAFADVDNAANKAPLKTVILVFIQSPVPTRSGLCLSLLRLGTDRVEARFQFFPTLCASLVGNTPAMAPTANTATMGFITAAADSGTITQQRNAARL
jgi:hypothetical protein